MSHLAPQDLLDLAEGNWSGGAPPHLDSCDACRRQVAELREALAIAGDAGVPEPSPLFWDHLSARVSAAIAAEGTPRASRLDRSVFARFAPFVLSVAAVALIVAVAVVSSRVAPPRQVVQVASTTAARTPVATGAPLAPASDASTAGDALMDDPAYSVVLDLTVDVDLDTALEAGLATEGSADHAVVHLDSGELRQLQQLLTDEIARSHIS